MKLGVCSKCGKQLERHVPDDEVDTICYECRIDPNVIYPGKDPDFTFPEETE